MQTFNWGIIGPGSIAHKFADAMTVSKKGRVGAVASRSAVRAKSFAAAYGIPRIFNEYSDLVNDPDIDIIYVATPHSFHYEHAKLCIEAGKHVLVEKPCTVNATQMQHLVKLAQANKVLLQEGLWSRFTPCLFQLRDSIEQGLIGDIQYIQSDIGFAFQGRSEPKARLLKAELAGGALLDLGIYSIALSHFFLKEEPQSIYATGQLSDEKVDEHAFVNMEYASNRYSQFTCSMLSQATNTMRIVGSKGYALLPAYFWDGTQALIYQNDELTQRIDIPHLVNGFEYQIEQTMLCVEAKQGCSELVSHQDSISVLKVMDEVRSQIGVVFPDEIEKL